MLYASLYGIDYVPTFIRTTLRYPEFCMGWKNIIDLKLTDEEKIYDTNGMTLANFFKQHFGRNNFSTWLQELLSSRLNYTKDMMDKLMQLMKVEEEASKQDDNIEEEVMVVDEHGILNTVNVDDIKDKAAEIMTAKIHEANLSIKQLFFLGMEDNETVINKGLCSAADVIQFILEQRLSLQPTDKDLVVLLTEVEYIQQNEKHQIKSCLVLKGEGAYNTAMSKAVGAPLAIATKLILAGKIDLKGLHIPTHSSIYNPVMKELNKYGFEFKEW